MEYAIEIENADVFLNRTEILHSINWKLKKGEKYFILGANGAGKTTLVKTILGYIWPKWGGVVRVLGEQFGKVDLNILRKKIAWISPFITEKLSNNTGVDVILSGREGSWGFFRRASESELNEVEALLKSLNALHLANKRIHEMSSGEQMKILIARALILKPQLMILDEPNVFLDIKEREFFLNLVDKIVKENPNLTVIFISQRIEDILPCFNNGMILKEGKILFEGERKKVLTKENLKETFDVNINLIETKEGRMWGIVE